MTRVSVVGLIVVSSLVLPAIPAFAGDAYRGPSDHATTITNSFGSTTYNRNGAVVHRETYVPSGPSLPGPSVLSPISRPDTSYITGVDGIDMRGAGQWGRFVKPGTDLVQDHKDAVARQLQEIRDEDAAGRAKK